MNKSILLSAAKELLLQKQSDLLAMIDDLNRGLAEDTKSSAGDKYETSRAMSQQELDKISVQLRENTRQLALIPELEESSESTTVQSGSLVETDNGFFFIGLPIGPLTTEGTTAFCISPTAPIAQQLLGKKSGDNCEMNGKKYRILALR